MSEEIDAYRRQIKPAIDLAIQLMLDMEAKHGKGLHMSPVDAQKCARHAISSGLGEANPDGQTHAVAALVRAIKMVLNE